MHEDKVYRVGEQLLLNGLFGVSNQEWVDSVEVLRIIMNLTPSNAIFRGFDGDVGTLPPWAGISPLHLPPHEQLLISSEDVRAFILHRFRAQSSWHPPLFLCFNRLCRWSYAVQRLDGGFPAVQSYQWSSKNSVSLPQLQVYRLVPKTALIPVGTQGSGAELRQDRSTTTPNPDSKRVF